MAHFIMFVIVTAIGFIAGRLSVVFLCILYNMYRIHSKLNKLYKNAKDERMRRDIFIGTCKKTKEGREYLENAYRLEQTKPERDKLRKKYKKGGE